LLRLIGKISTSPCAMRACEKLGLKLQQGSEIDLTEPTVAETVSRSAPDLRRALVIGLYETQHESLMRWARLLSTSEAAAEQLEREAFVKFYGSLHDPVLPDDAVRHVRRDLFEAARSGMRRNTPQRWQNDVIAPAENATPIDVGMLLVHGVQQLAARQRECIVLRHYGRLSDSLVARELGATLGSTRTHVRRATARLDGLVATLAGEDAELRNVLPLAFDAYSARPVAPPEVSKLVAMLERHDRLKAVRRVVIAGGALLLALLFAIRASAAHNVGIRDKQHTVHQPDTTVPIPVTPSPDLSGNSKPANSHSGTGSNTDAKAPSNVAANGSGSASANPANPGSQSGTGTGPQSVGENGPTTVGPVAASQNFWAIASENGTGGGIRWDIFGYAFSGQKLTLTSDGSPIKTVTATSEGFRGMVDIGNAPRDEQNVAVTISCNCGQSDIVLNLPKYKHAQPLPDGFSETEPDMHPTTDGFIVGGYVPAGASLVTITTAYGVRTFHVNGGTSMPTMWGGFIDFPNVPHGTTFDASITTDVSSATLPTKLTRR
jgi:DNA-directed RNA polymerase specialized sigma24 family protein